jgi:hypothetical protein
VQDGTYGSGTRRYALRALLKTYQLPTDIAMHLLQDISTHKDEDKDDLIGLLLEYLYPAHLSPPQALEHFRFKDDHSYGGSYDMFWSHHLLEKTPEQLLSELITELSNKNFNVLKSHEFSVYWRLAGDTLTKCLEVHGDNASDEQLYEWLGVALDQYKHSHLNKEHIEKIDAWFTRKPEKYFGVLSIGIKKTDAEHHIWHAKGQLHGISQPKDMGYFWLNQADKEPNIERARDLFCEAVQRIYPEWVGEKLTLDALIDWVDQRPKFQQLFDRLLMCSLDDPRHKWRIENSDVLLGIKKRDDHRVSQFRSMLDASPTNEINALGLYHLAWAWLGNLIEASGDNPQERLTKFLGEHTDLFTKALAALQATPYRSDLPSDEDILKSYVDGKIQLLSPPLFLGLELVFNASLQNFERIEDAVVIKALLCRYTYSAHSEVEWFNYLLKNRIELIAAALQKYAEFSIIKKRTPIYGLYPLAYDGNYAPVAKEVALTLVSKFPHRCDVGQLGDLEYLLKAALLHADPAELEAMLSTRLALKSLDIGQRIYLLSTGLLLSPELYESKIQSYVNDNEVRIGHLSHFLYERERHKQNNAKIDLSPSTLRLLINLLAPSCRPERPTGSYFVTPEMNRADMVRHWINTLGASSESTSTTYLKQLIELPSLKHWHESLHYALASQAVVTRDSNHHFPNPQQIEYVLQQGQPASAADLAIIVNDELALLIKDIEVGPRNIYRDFWNTDSHGRVTTPRVEEVCRNTLVNLLNERLQKYKIQCTTEALQAEHKRSDIWCAHQNYGIPIEVKRQNHKDIWTALQNQLVKLYTTDPRSQGFGIYLVLWFDSEGLKAAPSGKKPKTLQELKARLEESIRSAQRPFIQVHTVNLEKRNISDMSS